MHKQNFYESMAKKKEVRFYPAHQELNDMRICHQNNLAYVIVPAGGNKYWISKYSLNDLHRQIYLEEKNVRKEFSQYEADKKIMELYTQHSKRFNK